MNTQTSNTQDMKYADKVAVLIEALIAGDKASLKQAKSEYASLVSPVKIQRDFLNEVRIIAGNMPWNEMAKEIGISTRAMENYRLPEKSLNFRVMNDAVLRQVVNFMNQFIKDAEADTTVQEMEDISQKELFTIIKDLTGNPTWKELSAALEVNHTTLLNYILPSDSKNYREMPPAAFKEFLKLKNRLVTLTEEGQDEQELWTLIENGVFEKPDINMDLVEHMLPQLKKEAKALSETRQKKEAEEKEKAEKKAARLAKKEALEKEKLAKAEAKKAKKAKEAKAKKVKAKKAKK